MVCDNLRLILGGHAALQFLGRDILDMGGDPPIVARAIFHAGHAIAIERVHRFAEGLCPGIQRPLVRRIRYTVKLVGRAFDASGASPSMTIESPMRTDACAIRPFGRRWRSTSVAPKARCRNSITCAAPSTVR